MQTERFCDEFVDQRFSAVQSSQVEKRWLRGEHSGANGSRLKACPGKMLDKLTSTLKTPLRESSFQYPRTDRGGDAPNVPRPMRKAQHYAVDDTAANAIVLEEPKHGLAEDTRQTRDE